jgi:hypothetical protein
MKFVLLALALLLGSFSGKAQAATALGVADTTYLTNGQSMSALFSNNADWIQAYFGVNDTSGGFHFGLGGAYKFTIAGTGAAGIHVGPGLSLGNMATGNGNKIFFTIQGLVGGHITVLDRLILGVDGGPILAIVDGDTSFRLKPTGQILGLSVHYLF